MMKIAFFNIENLYQRDTSLIVDSLNRSLKLWMEEFEALLRKDNHMDTDYDRLRELSFLIGFQKVASEPYVILRKRKGTLYIRKRGNTLDYKANTLTDWNGWIKMGTRPVSKTSITNKARVITDCNPDILLLQELEDRTALMEFNDQYLSGTEKHIYHHCSLLAGNDYRGREMGVLSKKYYSIEAVRSYNYKTDGLVMFDQDFQQYQIRLPTGEELYVLMAQLQFPKGDKNWEEKRRKQQVACIANVYKALQEKGKKYIAIVGTFYVPSYATILAPIFRQTDARDISKHPDFKVELDKGRDRSYYRLGAYAKGINIKQEDYLTLSPALFNRVKACGLNRKGMWPKNRSQWKVYNSIKADTDAASNHPLIWIEL
ncbi:endonuclease/exonuclease/phosphatase family protein [Joostella atrarenae]|uniref:Endonuclease/exonuclease/phosphatase family protein n=1 Tax=Joostella atrarenae TaxID=679257 RepID=A0ABS9J7K1_9FLAO|nr:endonuclease/exonuclease/phosphatase family protein [Joostella atrarenae]MCF8716385.1 endonuclease/exonuclease/phosphatase family protein [Joostella atrarenae]